MLLVIVYFSLFLCCLYNWRYVSCASTLKCIKIVININIVIMSLPSHLTTNHALHDILLTAGCESDYQLRNVCLSVHPYGTNQLPLDWFLSYLILDSFFFENLSKEFNIHWNMTRVMDRLLYMKTLYLRSNIWPNSFRVRMFQIKC